MIISVWGHNLLTWQINQTFKNLTPTRLCAAESEETGQLRFEEHVWGRLCLNKLVVSGLQLKFRRFYSCSTSREVLENLTPDADQRFSRHLIKTGSLPSLVEDFLHCCCYSSAEGSLYDAMQHSFIQKHVETLFSLISACTRRYLILILIHLWSSSCPLLFFLLIYFHQKCTGYFLLFKLFQSI